MRRLGLKIYMRRVLFCVVCYSLVLHSGLSLWGGALGL